MSRPTHTETLVQFSQETPQQPSTERSSRLTKRTPYRARRYTPYAKTPATRSLRSTKRTGVQTQPRRGQARTPPSASSKGADSLRELINKTWRVYRLSPLYQFSTKSTDLQQYARKLSTHLEAELNKGLAMAADNDKANKAIFSVCKDLSKSPSEPEAIQIQLLEKPRNGVGGETRVVATAILTSIGASADVLHKVTDKFRYLPVMIYRGSVSLANNLIHWLQTQFDCIISPVVFSPVFMSWMVAMWAGSTLEKKGHTVQLQYKVPSSVEGLDHITLDIDSHDCKALWNCIHTDESETFHRQEVVTFIQALEAHFFHHFSVRISAMPLCKVGTAIAYLGAEGRLKIFSSDFIHQVLSHVTEFVLENSID